MRILGVIILLIGLLVNYMAGFMLVLKFKTNPLLSAALLILDVAIAAWFIGIIYKIYSGKTKKDGSHLSWAFWAGLGIACIGLAVGGIFTGYYKEHPTFSPIQGLLYLFLGMRSIRHAKYLFKNRSVVARKI